MIRPQTNRVAYIGVDYQQDFINDQNTDQTNKAISAFIKKSQDNADIVILTKTEHPHDHFSFAELGTHCVKGSKGARLHAALTHNLSDCILVTKFSLESSPPDSYSAFEGERLRPKTSLEDILEEENIDTIHIGGFGHSWDVPQTAYDAAALSYKTFIHVEATYPNIDHGELIKLLNAGIQIVPDLGHN